MAYFNESKDGKVTVDFSIKAMPMPLYQKFTTMAEQEYGNCFWMTIAGSMSKADILDKIDMNDTFIKTQFDEVWAKLEEIENSTIEKEKKVKTLGSD